jgi:hypothetical protein
VYLYLNLNSDCLFFNVAEDILCHSRKSILRQKNSLCRDRPWPCGNLNNSPKNP